MPTWPWRHPSCSLAAALHRYSIRMYSILNSHWIQRGRVNAAQAASPTRPTCMHQCNIRAPKTWTLQSTGRTKPSVRWASLWCWNSTNGLHATWHRTTLCGVSDVRNCSRAHHTSHDWTSLILVLKRVVNVFSWLALFWCFCKSEGYNC